MVNGTRCGTYSHKNLAISIASENEKCGFFLELSDYK